MKRLLLRVLLLVGLPNAWCNFACVASDNPLPFASCVPRTYIILPIYARCRYTWDPLSLSLYFQNRCYASILVVEILVTIIVIHAYIFFTYIFFTCKFYLIVIITKVIFIEVDFYILFNPKYINPNNWYSNLQHIDNLWTDFKESHKETYSLIIFY